MKLAATTLRRFCWSSPCACAASRRPTDAIGSLLPRNPLSPAPAVHLGAPRLVGTWRIENRTRRDVIRTGHGTPRRSGPLPPAEEARGGRAARCRADAAAGGPPRARRAGRRPRDRPARMRAVRGLGRERQGRRDQAPRRRARPAPRPRGPVLRAELRREAPPLALALLARAARLGRDVGARPLVVRPRARRAGGEVRDPRAV